MRPSNEHEPKPEYRYPLLIRQLLASGIDRAPEQEIVYANKKRLSYREMGDRVRRLAAGLESLGIREGDTVAVMDWDTNRYLECFFAIPMMGAVLHTINVRLSPEQILYTINHAEDSAILVHTDFLPMLEQIWSRIEPGKKTRAAYGFRRKTENGIAFCCRVRSSAGVE